MKLEQQRVNLGDYLQECHASNLPLAGAKSIEFDLAFAEPLPQVYLDPNRINPVLNNLITNALKFSLPQTRSTLGARSADKSLEIFVRDQGLGIPENEIPLIFKEFSKASVTPTAGEKSTGLGLAIVKKMVESYGGRIWVTSQVV